MSAELPFPKTAIRPARAARRSARRSRGNMAMIAVLGTVPLALAAGYGVELAGIGNERAMLQSAADSGALAGASELQVLTRGLDGIETTVNNHALAQLGGYVSEAHVSFTTAADRDAGTVVVQGTAIRPSTFGFLGASPVRIDVTATAEVANSGPLCILQTEMLAGSIAPVGVALQDTASVRAPTCLVHANHNMDLAARTSLVAGTVQSSGKVTGPVTANSGAMEIPDPFESLDLKLPSGCPAGLTNERMTGNGTLRLAPGVHCRNFQIGGRAVLELQPGEHWFMGQLDLNGNSTLRGDDVALIFSDTSSFSFSNAADIEITGRRTGTYAGFLVMTTRDNQRDFMIQSNKVKELLGTIYIPNARLVVSTKGNVAQDSAWSVIVARSILLQDSPVLVINTGYAGSNVPVPAGVGPSADGDPRLAR